MKYTILLIFIATLIICSCHSKEEAFKKAVALYEIGKLYEEKDLADSAVVYYSKAYQISKESGSDSLAGIIGNSFGKILQIQELYKNAIQIHSEAYLYNNNLKDKTAASTSSRAIGKDYLFNTKVNDSIYNSYKDSAFKYFTNAAQLIPQIKSQEEISIIYNNLCLYYTVDKQFNKALQYNKKSIQTCRDSTNQYRNYSSRGNIYSFLHYIDSAIYYCNRALKSKDIFTQCTNYYKLADIYSQLGSSDSAKYMKLANTLHDSINRKTYGENFMQTVHKIKIEQIEQQKKKNIALITMTILIIGSSGFLIYRKYFRKRFTIQQKELNAQKRQTKVLEQRLQESLQIENYADLQASKQSEEEKITAQIIQLGNEIAIRFRKTKIYNEINNKTSLSNEERAQLSHTVLKEFHVYIKEIRKYIQLAEEDYFVCCLSQIGFSTKQCAICRGVGEAAIRVQRKRIKEKLKTFFHSEKLYESIFMRKS